MTVLQPGGAAPEADLFRLLADNISDYALFVIDADRRVKTWNPAAERLFGYTADEIIGEQSDRFFTPEDRAAGRPEEELQEALSTGRGDDDRWHIRKDGSRFWSAGVLTPLRDPQGQLHGFVKITRDQTTLYTTEQARREAEERLRQSEDRFRGLIEQAPFSVQVFSPDGLTVRVNRAWEELWGIPAERLGNYNVLADPQLEAKGVAPHLRQAFSGKPALLPEIPYDPEETVPGKTQYEESVRWVAGVAYPIKDATGAVREVVLVHEDVTARRKAEAEVREKAETLSGILEASVDNIYVVGQDGRYRYVSTGGARTLGFRSDEMTGRHWKDLGLPAAVMEPFDAQRDEVFRTGRPARCDVSFTTPDGDERQFEYVIAPLVRGESRSDAVVVVSRDMTDRLRTERLLDRYRLLSEYTRDIVFFVRSDGQIVEANEAAANAYGFDRSTLHTMNVAELRTPDTLPDVPRQLAAASDGGLRFETTHRRRDGSQFPVEVSSRGAEIGGERLLLSVVRDITERKEAEARLLRAERNSRFLADAGAALAGLTDYESTLAKVAALSVPHFADWCAIDMVEGGVPRRVAVAHADLGKVELAHEYGRRFPPDPAAPRGVWNILRTGEPEIIPEISDELLTATVADPEQLRLLREIGLKSYIGVPLKVRDSVLGVLTFVSAESGRRFDERDLQLAEDLARRAAVAVENARLYDEVRQADRRKDEFLAMLAHELRNPLAPIRSGLDLLSISEAEPEVVHLMKGQVEHLVRLVDDLLDVSRILRGRVELKRSGVDLSEVVRTAAETVRSMFETEGQEFTLSLPLRPVRLEADPVRLAQVLSNLLTNASKYTEAGGKINLAADVENGELVLRVSDSGIGIDRELLPHVFDLFTQSTRGIDRAQGGLGIGLTIVKNLVEMHGGTVAAHSEGPGCGSEFTVRLPLREPVAESSVAPTRHSVLPKHRILVVDDNVPAAKLLVRLLSKLGGHEIVSAHDGEGALAAAEAYRPSLILLDIGLPKLDGYAVAKRLRANREFQATLLVALTGYGTEEDKKRSKEAGFDEHITKPPSVDVLRSVLSHPKLTRA